MTTSRDAILQELRNASPASVENVDLSIPRDLEVAIAARQRQLLRNSAVLAQLNLTLAHRRNARDESVRHAEQLDQYVRDIAEIDRLYPEAKARMQAFDQSSREPAQEPS